MVQTRLPATQRREQMLDACRSVVDGEGFHAVTINRVAHDCGVTRTVVYQQFGSLNAMLIALVDREIDRAGQGFLGAVHYPAAPTGFGAAMAGVFGAVDADPATWRMFMMPSEGGPPELYEHLERARAAVLGYVVGVIGKRSPEGDGASTADGDTELIARSLHAIADELVRLRLRDPDTYPVDRLLRHAGRVSAALLAGS
ncbi:TetR/AcrR family transcriptional regulator [Gordonia sp. ABSL1-1]|uniref:TetR/AcrR family transcriptional regulator n=1 Tax=Gordonia sp. ABSL1-1 TaxID=3053923 RepID=UPI00257418CA|nr:TetR/AcrR family transcriptional regulator [Gordonia sp. ABSL1-1]MDL9937216.1 TetR/AcrR family transcriptional regulator [Gordonia sp. ABSL1-1]